MNGTCNKLALAVAFGLALAFTFSCGKHNGGDDSGSNAEISSSSSGTEKQSSSSDGNTSSSTVSVNKFVAKPTSEVGNKKIKYSYSYKGYDFYYIYLGEMKNIPLFHYEAEHHNGMNSIYTIESTETIKNSVTETIVNSSKTAIDIVDAYTKSTTTGGKISAEIKADVNVLFGLVKIQGPKAADELYQNDYVYNSKIIDIHQTTSLTNTITTGTEYTKSTMKSRTWNFTKDDKVGYYRYTLFSASDIYLYVIKDSTGAIYYEFREYVIPESLNNNAWVLDYSEDGSFRKSDTTSFEFDVSMLDNLPKPDISLNTLTTNATTGGSVESVPNQIVYKTGTQVTVTAKPNNNYVFNGWIGDLPKGVNASLASITFAIDSDITLTANFRALVEKTETVEFTIVGNHTYTFDKGLPATIEIYALGAGGAGQGGHSKDRGIAGLFENRDNGVFNGTGGAGGGGAVTYMKFDVTEQVTFSINIGSGGIGGSGIYRSYTENWQSGTPGGKGGNTSVSWGSNTLTAEGGYGGGGDGTITTGGGGGRANTTWPILWLDNSAVAGKSGSNGNGIDDKYGDIKSTGGNAALISKGSIASFGGGSGALRQGSNTGAADSGGGGSGGYSRDQSGSTGGNGQVIIVVKYNI